MPIPTTDELSYVGFFHLSATLGDHPVKLLEAALDRSGFASLYRKALLVLPEAFNIIGEYYGQNPSAPDPEVEARIAAISAQRGLCFVAGLIRYSDTRYSEAVLIDGGERKTLTLKNLPDG